MSLLSYGWVLTRFSFAPRHKTIRISVHATYGSASDSLYYMGFSTSLLYLLAFVLTALPTMADSNMFECTEILHATFLRTAHFVLAWR